MDRWLKKPWIDGWEKTDHLGPRYVAYAPTAPQPFTGSINRTTPVVMPTIDLTYQTLASGGPRPYRCAVYAQHSTVNDTLDILNMFMPLMDLLCDCLEPGWRQFAYAERPKYDHERRVW